MAETREEQAKRIDGYADTWEKVAPAAMALDVTALRAGAAALRAQGEDDAEWWRQVAQGLAAEYHKLKQSWPRCEWRPYPGGPQCEKPAGHGPSHYTISDKPMGASMGKPHSGPHIHHHYKPSVDDPNICGMCGDGPWGIHRVQVTFDNCPICIEAARLRECANAQEPVPEAEP